VREGLVKDWGSEGRPGEIGGRPGEVGEGLGK